MKDLNIFEKGLLGVFGITLLVILYMIYMSSAGATVDKTRFSQIVLVALSTIAIFGLSFINSGIWDNLCHRDIKIYALLWAFIATACFLLHREGFIDLVVVIAKVAEVVVNLSLGIANWLSINLLGGV